jgi:redox-sensitive bicupin YhaK (pirin superfamily)
MTAGRGIVHSERTSTQLKVRGFRLFGLQTWVALPAVHEETDPSFTRYEEENLPVLETDKRVRVVVGQAWGLRSPVKTFSDTIYGDISLEPGAVLPLDEHTRSAQSMWLRRGEYRGRSFPVQPAFGATPGWRDQRPQCGK